MSTPHILFNSYSSFVPFNQTQELSIKTVLKLSVCILPSVGVSAETLTCGAVKELELVNSPHITNPHPALQHVTPLLQIGPVHE